MTPRAQVTFLVVAVLALLTLGLSRQSAVPPGASPSVPQVMIFGQKGGYGMRIVVYYPDEKKLYEYNDNGTCDNSWTLTTPGRLTEEKCK